MITKLSNNFLLAVATTLTTLTIEQNALASSVQGAVVTRTEGESQLMIKKVSGAPAPAGTKAIVFEKETYYVRPVKNGDRPANGDVVTTGKDGKVRLIYRNGDQVTVTPGTAFKFSWDSKTDKSAIAEVVYGDIRAVIQPEGPRSGMQVKTKSAVMGVRGTDFYVSAWSKEAGSKVAVMRGTVAVAPKADESTAPIKTKEVEVTAGASGVVKQQTVAPAETLALTEAKKDAPAPIVEVTQTSKQELVVIQQDSKVVKPKLDDAIKAADPVAKEITQLEAACVDTTLQDVKKHDPQLYAQITEENKKSKLTDVDTVQAETVKKIFVTAPSIKEEPRKPTLNDLESGGDIYDKYKWERN